MTHIEHDSEASEDALQDECPGPSRFLAVALNRGAWSRDERLHIARCNRCLMSAQQVSAAVQDTSQIDTAVQDDDTPTEVHLTKLIAGNADLSRVVSGLEVALQTLWTTSGDARSTAPLDDSKSLDELTRSDMGSDFGSSFIRSFQALGHYKLISLIGRGGMGVVYRAIDTRLDRTVAIKVSSSLGMSDQSLDRFMSEARITARLAHPSIVPILDVGHHNDVTYTVTPYIEGVSLSALSKQHTPMSIREVARIMAEIADAVHYAHEQGVLHRDIKPSNILIGEQGRPVLMDFGLAKSRSDEASLTSEREFIGTPAYASPEQAAGDLVLDPRSDIYSLGATLYSALTGRAPIQSRSTYETIEKLRSENYQPPRPHSLRPEISRDLEAICLKALQRRPERRYQTAKEMADDLRRYLQGVPVACRRLNVVERSWRWARRHWLLFAAIALVAAGLAYAATMLMNMPPKTAGPLGPIAGELALPWPEVVRPVAPRPITPADHASALNDLGKLYRDLDRPAQAEAAYRRSAALLHQLANEHTDVTAYREGLADAYHNLAELLRAGGRVDEANAADEAVKRIRLMQDD